jgi:MFS family permease
MTIVIEAGSPNDGKAGGDADTGVLAVASPSTGARAWPGAATRYYALAVLTIAYAVSFIDRTIMSMQIEPIKASLHLNDTQISLLTGLAFSVFYALMGMPLGRLVDWAPRKWVIAGGIALWSVVTSTCGLAGNFAQLFLSRMGVGVGEAALSPGAFSMLSDLFKPAERNRAGGIYTLGVSAGAALAYLVGGLVLQGLKAQGGGVLPILGKVAPWRFAFIVVGLPGLVVALIMLTVKEPLRRGRSKSGSRPSDEMGLFTFLNANWKAAYGCLFGYGLLNIPFNVILQWGPAFFLRAHHLNFGQVGLILGLIFLGPSMAGQLLGGWLSDRGFMKGSRAAPMTTALGCAIILIPVSFLAFVTPLPIAIALVGAITFLVCASVGHGPSALTLMSPSHLRGRVTAFYFLILQVVVVATSSTLVALISDFVLHDPSKLNVSMSLVSGVCAILAAIVLKSTIKPFVAAVDAHNTSATA